MAKSRRKAGRKAHLLDQSQYVQNPTVTLYDQRISFAGVGPSLDSVAAAIQQQVLNEFSKAWSAPWGQNVKVVAKSAPDTNDFALAVVDQSNFGLGYHDYDPSRANPFYGQISGSGSYWSITASHEVLEILADPYTNNCAGGYRQEVCDPVENLSYRISGIAVSDFAYPAWFGQQNGSGVPASQYDQVNTLTNPNDSSNGYITQCLSGPGGVMGLYLTVSDKFLPSLIRGRAHPLASTLLGRQKVEMYRGLKYSGWQIP